MRKAERAGAVQSGEKKAPRRPPCSLLKLNGVYKQKQPQTFQ